ncbi:hypothetical protein GCM10014719_67660 [Planomonospora parontospora subsp. antibiotica]|nr:hypothetical protein GCM10014719_67660 [Planomonospora parontospora subsp. antibiotica]GII19974.1 hypothetical protein Ppa05_67000 [Planomonospora parontospora subsp. antibiotica]
MHPEPDRDSRTLCAVLLNPALRPAPETISFRNLGCALPLMGCDRLRLANLLDVPSKDQDRLGAAVIEESDVLRSRKLLAEAVAAADEILFAWGSNRVTGQVGARLREQAEWLRRHLREEGVRRVWMVAGSPRHPSRWRQYVGPEKARVEGSTFEERLAKVLAVHSLE